MAQGSGLLKALARQRVGAAPMLVSIFPHGRGHIQSTGLCGGCAGFGRYGCCGGDEGTCSWTQQHHFSEGLSRQVFVSPLSLVSVRKSTQFSKYKRGVCADHHKPFLYRELIELVSLQVLLSGSFMCRAVLHISGDIQQHEKGLTLDTCCCCTSSWGS